MTNPIALTFVAKMEAVWKSFGNVSSEGLRRMWFRMAEVYVDAIVDNLKPNPLYIGRPGWLVMAPEMGSGKTVGACVFLGLMARAGSDYGGALLACRTIKQCEKAVSLINEHAGFEAAITRHSENSVTLNEASNHPVLVITHAALVGSGNADQGALVETYSRWALGPRPLTVIDEALANAVEFNTITEQSLHKAMGQIPATMKDRHKEVLEVLEGLLSMVKTFSVRDTRARGLWEEFGSEVTFFDHLPKLFDELLADLKGAGRQGYQPNWNDPDQRKADLEETQATLRSVVSLFRSWTMFAPGGARPGLVSARSLLPDLGVPIVLDATAKQDPLLDHIGARVVPLPPVRNYRNLTIKLLRSKGIGKEAMRVNAKERLKRLGVFVRASSEQDDQWMVVTHKGNEDIARLNLPVENCMVGHWGALDGLNDFRECNKAVLFGLSYRDPTWSTALYFALRGLQPDEWFGSEEAKQIKHELESKAMAAQILQALGRPRSRNVCDTDGNCLPTTVYLTLPQGKLGRSIEQHIRGRLPGVVIEPWGYRLGGREADNEGSKRNANAAVVTHMANRPPGRWTVKDVAAHLDLTQAETTALKDGLKKKRGVYDDLTTVGVDYVVEGKGRGAKSYLVKRR